MSLYKRFGILCLLMISLVASLLAQAPKSSGSLHGQVTDPDGAVVIGAAITVTSADGAVQKVVSDKQGNYFFHALPAGSATVAATVSGFTPYSMPNVIIPVAQSQQLDIVFSSIATKSEQVTVRSESTTVDVNPENNASATVLKEQDLEALSDDPDELEQDLLALAGPSVGPNGGQIYIDGFSNGTLPPKSAIREVRINQNPFSAAYDRPGFGRIEVFTKPGTDTWHGQLMFNERNKALNSRNPYIAATDTIPPYHTERYSGNVGGALSKKLSFFLNAERRDINELAAVDATTALDASGNPVPFTQAVLSPQTRTNISPRIDWQVTPTNALTARYQFLKDDEFNQGMGGLTLASRADILHHTQQTVQATDTQTISTHVVNETRFQYIRDDQTQAPVTSGLAALNILGEFNTGGSILDNAHDTSNLYEVQNNTFWSAGKHSIKFGGRLRASQDTNFSTANFNGTFSYTGTATVSPLQAYLAGAPSQLSIVTGSPYFNLSFADVGLFAEDDWKLRPNLTLSYGLRFESQSNIHDKADFAPRLGLSWGLGKAGNVPKTVLRLGYGIFYDRFTSDLVLQAERENGVTEQQTIYTATSANPITCPVPPVNYNPAQPPSFTVSQCTLPPGTATSTKYQINPNLHAPYTSQVAASVERQLGSVGTISVTYLNSRGLHQLDLINANAPYSPTYNSTLGNTYQYYSEAVFKQNQLITNVQIRLSQKFTLNSFYALGYANSDTAGPSSNPSNSAHLTDDYGRASFDVRNKLFFSGTASLAHNIRISPFIIANSGAPFNIITGTDLNNDSFFNDRPSFSTACASGPLPANIVSNHYGCFNLTPAANDPRIPVNYGHGPANVTVNLRASKTFGFGADTKKASASAPSGGPGGGPGGGGGGRGPGGGMAGPRGLGNVFGPSSTTRRYNLTIAAMARNLFNTWNPGAPIGDLSSTMFGKSNSLPGGPFSAGSTANRIFDLSATFAF